MTMLPHTYRPTEDFGVRRDTLIEARIEVEDAVHRLKEMRANLDEMADSTDGIWSKEEGPKIREMQQEMDQLIDSKEDDIEHINRELVTLKQQERAVEEQ